MLGGKRHGLTIAPDSSAPFLTAVVSIPLALLFSLGVQGDSSAYIIGIISLGVLTSLDLKHGLVRVVLGFVVSLLVFAYAIEHSVIGQGLSPLPYGDWTLFLVSLSPSLGVLVAGLLFSEGSRYNMIKANLLASIALAIGLGVGSAMKGGATQSLNSVIFNPVFIVALGVAANLIQMVLLHFLDKLWKTRQFSLAMMPTSFFTFNLLNFLGYFSSQNLDRLYPFLSSLGFLPALALAGIGSGTLAKKMSGALTVIGPKITVTGNPLVRQGKDETIKIATETGGQTKNMTRINAIITKPGGKIESLKLSRISSGLYKAFYRPKAQGSYTIRVTATSKEHQTTDKSFSFNVQVPPTAHSPQTAPKPVPQNPPQSLPPQSTAPPRQPPTMPTVGPGLSRLDNWDPKVWLNREVHGYVIREHLATGLTGYVFRASFEHGGTEMAIKIPILRTGTGTTALDETMSEATKLLELSEQSKYVVQLHGILVDRLNVQEIAKGDTTLYLHSPPAIIMELMKGGAAKKLLEDPSYDPLYYSEKWGGIVMMVGYMIATALETIHRDGFVHLDVKPQNILFNIKPPVTGQEMIGQLMSGTLVPKLADLGSAVRTEGKVIQFTSEYAPAEQVLGSSAASSMDVYALGAMLYNMLTKTPVNSKKLIDMMNSIQGSGSGRAADDLRSAWNSFTPDLARIDPKFSSVIPVLREMLAKDPRQRPTAGAVASTLRSLGDKQGSRR